MLPQNLHDPFSCFPIPVLRDASLFAVATQDFARFRYDLHTIGADNRVGAFGDRDRPLGVRPIVKHGTTRTVVSSCKPPLSVRTNLARASRHRRFQVSQRFEDANFRLGHRCIFCQTPNSRSRFCVRGCTDEHRAAAPRTSSSAEESPARLPSDRRCRAGARHKPVSAVQPKPVTNVRLLSHRAQFPAGCRS